MGIAYFTFFVYPDLSTDYIFKDSYKTVDIEKKTIIIYDDFSTEIESSYKNHKTHGDMVFYVLRQAMKAFEIKSSEYNVLLINSKELKYDALFHILETISKKTKKKKIFVNLSIAPSQNFGVDYFIQKLNTLSQNYTNIYFFISAGNYNYAGEQPAKFNDLWKHLEHDEEFRKFTFNFNTTPNIYSKSFHLYIFYRSILNIFTGSEQEHIKKIFDKYADLNDSEKTVLSQSLLSFLFSTNIHLKNVKIVGGKDIFNQNVEKIKNNLGVIKAIKLSDPINDINYSRLDPPISYLSNIDTREISTFYYDDGRYYVPISGSSFSSPIALIRFIKNEESLKH